MSDTAISRKAVLLECLHRRVLTQELGLAGNLDEARLSDEFCLSRAALRELAGESYVELQRKRSARVPEMSDTMLSDFFHAAPMIYGAVLRLAATHANIAQIDQPKAVKVKLCTALASGDVAAKAYRR